MAMDARIRYTKMIIQVNFISLLKQKPIKRITVKEICELAEINRATFYKYYADAYDLMEKIEDEILQELQSAMESFPKGSIHETLLGILKKMKENGELYMALFSGNGDTDFPMKIFRLCYAEFSDYINSLYPKMTKTQQAWLYVYTAQGSCGILNYWLSDGMAESPAEVAEFIEKLISNTLKNLK